MEFYRKNYRSLLGYKMYDSVLTSVRESLAMLTGTTDKERIDDALWDVNPTISYNPGEGVGVLLPSKAAGSVVIRLKGSECETGASKSQQRVIESLEPSDEPS